MGLLKLLLFHVVFVSIVTNSQNTQNETESILTRTKRYHEAPTPEVNRPKRGNPVPLKSYIVENSAPIPKVPVIKPRPLNLRLDNNVNIMPRKIVQITEQPKKMFRQINNLTPLNHNYHESTPTVQSKPSNTKSVTEIHEINHKNKEPKHNEIAMIPKHEFYEDDIDYDDVNKIKESQKSVHQKQNTTVNMQTLPKPTDGNKLQKNFSKSEHIKSGISESFEHKTNMNPNMHHINTVDKSQLNENKLKVNVPTIANGLIINKTETSSHKLKSDLPELIPKNVRINQYEQTDNHNHNKNNPSNINDVTQSSDKDVENKPDYAEIEDAIVITNAHDKEYSNNVKPKPMVNPIKDIMNEATGNIVIKNRTFKEVCETTTMKIADNSNINQNQDLWSTPQIWFNGEWTPYYYYYVPYTANYGTNEEIINKPDFTYTKPPYQYPCEDKINLNDLMDKKPKYYDITNKIPDYKDRVLRKWKDVEICNKPFESKPVSFEIEQNPSDSDDKVIHNGLKTTIFNGYSQGVIDCDGYYNGNNYNVATWYPCCYYPSYSYGY